MATECRADTILESVLKWHLSRDQNEMKWGKMSCINLGKELSIGNKKINPEENHPYSDRMIKVNKKS